MDFSSLPLLLAGPILRRVEPHAVAVFVALKEAKSVTLVVHSTQPIAPGPIVALTTTQTTVQIGEHVHVLTLYANATLDVLHPGVLYRYDLIVDGQSIVDDDAFRYPGLTGPTFALPPPDITDLRVVHVSCRKPHGGFVDALPALDDMLADSAADPIRRPHLLLQTGDQIYADDVAIVVLDRIHQLLPVLFADWGVETFPASSGQPAPPVEGVTTQPSDPQNVPLTYWASEHRAKLVADHASLTSGAGSCHLLTFAEYAAMYLLVWSPVLWSAELPDALSKFGQQSVADKKRLHYETEHYFVTLFIETMPKVRKALANVPSYMMFDDHEVSDDWYLSREVCKGVLSKPLGRKIMMNGLLAYSVFQGWGNKPGELARGVAPAVTLGDLFFIELTTLCRPAGAVSAAVRDGSRRNLARRMGIPESQEDWTSYQATLDAVSGRTLPRTNDTFTFHYGLRTPNFDLLVLDTRTRRRYPGTETTSPELLSPAALLDQVPDVGPRRLTLVLSPAPVIGVDWIDSIQLWAGSKANYGADPEGWIGQPAALAALLNRLAIQGSRTGGHTRAEAIFFSGDVHYAFGAHARLWAPTSVTPGGTTFTNVHASFVQFTSSAAKNQQPYEPHLRNFLEERGFGLENPLLDFVVWNNPNGDRLEIGRGRSRQGIVGPTEPLHSGEQPYIHRNHTHRPGGTEYRNWHQHIRVRYVSDDPIVDAQPGDPTRHALLLRQMTPGNWHRRLLNRVRYEYHNKKLGELLLFNNIGEVRIRLENGDRIAMQDLWWKLEEGSNGGRINGLFPYTRHRVPLSAPLNEQDSL